jgi:predicted Zn-dependent peptidase
MESGVDHLTTSLDNLGKLSVLTLLGSCPARREQEILRALLNSVLGATAKMTEETLLYAKTQLKTRLALALSDTRTIAEELALQLLYWKGWRNLDDWIKLIDALTLSDVRRAVDQFFAHDAPCTIVTFAPAGQVSSANA